jgi:DNA-binding NarL/FixJ family response regulator
MFAGSNPEIVSRAESAATQIVRFPVGTLATQRHEISSERPQVFATVLIGQSGLFQEGLTWILTKTEFHVVASASRVDELVLAAELRHQPFLLIVEVDNDPESAIRQIELFKEQHPAARIAVVADLDRFDDIVSMFRAGANALFPRGVTSTAFLKSLELVMLGETFLPSGILPFILDRAHEAPTAASNYTPILSAQQLCILGHLANGHANKVIANKLKITEATVKVHVKAILGRIGARNRTQAAVWAIHNGSPEHATDDGPPASSRAAVQLTFPVEPPTARRGPTGRAVVKTTSPPETRRARASAKPQQTWPSERRIVEEEQRHDEIALRTNRLRELRTVRDAAKGV